MVEKIKKTCEHLEESFTDIADEVFPFRRKYLQMSSDDFLSYYHEKHSKISVRRIFYLAPFFILFILVFVMMIGTFLFVNDWVVARFNVFFFAFLLLALGLFYSLGQELKGPLLLMTGNCLLLLNREFGLPIAIALCCCFFLSINITKCQRFDYYKDLAVNVMQNKLRLELEEMELSSLLDRFNADFERFQKKGDIYEKNG